MSDDKIHRKKIVISPGLCPSELSYIEKKKDMNTDLLYRYFKGEASRKEEEQILEWIESSAENRETFLNERFVFDATSFFNPSTVRRKPKGHLYLYPLLAITAMVSIVFVMDLPHMHKPEQRLSQCIYIPTEQTAQITLPDSSVISLHPRSKLAYEEDFGRKHRKVMLDGEAGFEIQPHKAFPFQIEVAGITLQTEEANVEVVHEKETEAWSIHLVKGSLWLWGDDVEKQHLAEGEHCIIRQGKIERNPY